VDVQTAAIESRSHVADDLLFLVSHYDGDLVNSCHRQGFYLVVKNGLVVDLNQTFWTLAVDGPDPCALPRS